MLQTTLRLHPVGRLRTIPSCRRPTACRTGAGSSSTRNNTPRIARIDLTTFETDEIIEIPNSAGNHASPFITQNTEYVVSAHALQRADPAAPTFRSTSYKENFKGTLSLHQGRPARARWTSRSRS